MSEDPIMSHRKSAQCMTDKNLKKLELAQVLGSDNAERPPESRCCIGIIYYARSVNDRGKNANFDNS